MGISHYLAAAEQGKIPSSCESKIQEVSLLLAPQYISAFRIRGSGLLLPAAMFVLVISLDQ